jgi:hypothetical protein
LGHVGIKEVEILKDKKNEACGENAGDQINFALFAFLIFDQHSRPVIDKDGDQKDQDVHRNKGHIEITTGRQKKKPSPAVRDQEINPNNSDKENIKLN